MIYRIFFILLSSLAVIILGACKSTGTPEHVNPTFTQDLTKGERPTLDISQIPLPDSLFIGVGTSFGLLDLSDTGQPIFKTIPIDADLFYYEISPDHNYLAYLESNDETENALFNILDLETWESRTIEIPFKTDMDNDDERYSNWIEFKFSPDSKYLAYLDSNDETGNAFINILDLETLESRTIEFPYKAELVNIDERYRNWIEFNFSPDSQKLSYISLQTLYIYNLENGETTTAYKGPSGNYLGGNQRSQLFRASWISNECLIFRSFEGSMPFSITINLGENRIPVELYANTNTLTCLGTNPTTSYFGDEGLVLESHDKESNFLILRGIESRNRYIARLSSNTLEIEKLPLPDRTSFVADYDFIDKSIVVYDGLYQFNETGIPYLKTVIVDMIDIDTISLTNSTSFEIPINWGDVESYKPLLYKQDGHLVVSNIIFTVSGNPSELRIGDLERGTTYLLWTIEQTWIFLLD